MPGQLTNLTIPESLEKYSVTKSYDPHTIVARRDDLLKHLYLVEKGFLKIYTILDNGKKSVHQFYGPGDVFLIPQLVFGITSEMYYEATEETVCKLYPGDKVLEELKTNASFSFETMKFSVIQAIHYRYRMDNLSLKYSSERIAYRLLLIASKFGKKDGNAIYLPTFTQEDLADTVSLSRESASKGIKRLERLEAIKYQDGKICISDVSKLFKELSGVNDLPPFFASLQ